MDNHGTLCNTIVYIQCAIVYSDVYSSETQGKAGVPLFSINCILASTVVVFLSRARLKPVVQLFNLVLFKVWFLIREREGGREEKKNNLFFSFE